MRLLKLGMLFVHPEIKGEKSSIFSANFEEKKVRKIIKISDLCSDNFGSSLSSSLCFCCHSSLQLNRESHIFEFHTFHLCNIKGTQNFIFIFRGCKISENEIPLYMYQVESFFFSKSQRINLHHVYRIVF